MTRLQPSPEQIYRLQLHALSLIQNHLDARGYYQAVVDLAIWVYDDDQDGAVTRVAEDLQDLLCAKG